MASLETNINQVNADFNSIKEAIVSSGVEVVDGTKTSEYADKIDNVFEKGKEAYWNEFWDGLQQNGSRTGYAYAFMRWDLDLFYPKYNIVGGLYLFQFAGQNGTSKCDLIERLKECNVTIDFSKTTNPAYSFYYTGFTTLPALDFSNCTGMLGVFGYSKFLEKIEKITVTETLKFDTTTFIDCIALKDIVIEGEIGNDINFQWSTLLNKEGIVSIVSALSETTGATLTLSQTAVDNAFETGTDLNDGSTSEEWINLITPKSSDYDEGGLWTISLA